MCKGNWERCGWVGWIVAAVFFSACQSSPNILAIDLRTDLVAGVEFDGVRVFLDERTFDHVPSAESYLAGLRIATFERVSAGRHALSVELLSDTEVVLDRSYLLDLDRGVTGMTVCRPETAEISPAPMAMAASAGRVVSPSTPASLSLLEGRAMATRP